MTICIYRATTVTWRKLCRNILGRLLLCKELKCKYFQFYRFPWLRAIEQQAYNIANYYAPTHTKWAILHFDWFPAHILSVHSMCFYQIWRSAESTKTSQSFGSKLESLCTTGMIYTVFLTFTASLPTGYHLCLWLDYHNYFRYAWLLYCWILRSPSALRRHVFTFE